MVVLDLYNRIIDDIININRGFGLMSSIFRMVVRKSVIAIDALEESFSWKETSWTVQCECGKEVQVLRALSMNMVFGLR